MVFDLVSKILQLLVVRKKYFRVHIASYTAHAYNHPYEYRTCYCIFDLFLSLPSAWLYAFAVEQMNTPSGLDQLVTASSMSDTLREIQKELRLLRGDVNRLKANGPTPPPREPAVIPRSGDQDPTQRISGTSWAEEMDILDPILDEQPGDEARVVEVSPHTGACITASFRSMTNNARRTLRSKFILPLLVPLDLTRFMPTRARRAPNSRTSLWHVCKP